MQSEASHPALTQLHDALAKCRQAPEDVKLQQASSRLLSDLATQGQPLLATYHPVVDELLVALLRGNAVSHQTLALIAVSQLRSKYQIDRETDPADQQPLLVSLAQDILFLETLNRTVNTDPEFEDFLRKLRRFLLFESRRPTGVSPQLIPLTAALAQQCFNNEYILMEEDDERILVNDVETECARELRRDPVQASQMLLLVLGMYRFPARLPSADTIANIPLTTFPEPVRPVIARMIHQPLEENRLRDDIPSFAGVTSTTSKMVRAQYEENPYPRWFSLGGPFSALETRLKRIRPDFSWPTAFLHEFRILVPGCGTGQQPLAIARGNPDADVVAIDLSKASLAYGKRMAGSLGIRNVTFLHGDLAEVSKLQERFHHIDCVGVLHHMADPTAGWRSLAGAVLSGGTLHLGLYSRVARLQIDFIRAQVKRLALEASAEGMKALRQQILTGEQYKPLFQALNTPGFYNLGSFRDLFFHVQERSYTLSEIRQLIDLLNLEFLGFKISSPILKSKYRERFPDDPRMNNFDNWCQFESSYMGTAVMFDFWLRKPES